MYVENLILLKDYWTIVQAGVHVLPITPTLKQNKLVDKEKLKDLKEMNYLFHLIDRGVIETIIDKSYSTVIWDSTAKKYRGSTKMKRVQLHALDRSIILDYHRVGWSLSFCSKSTLRFSL